MNFHRRRSAACRPDVRVLKSCAFKRTEREREKLEDVGDIYRRATRELKRTGSY